MPIKITKERTAVVYFSRSGNTRFAAQKIAALCGGCAVFEITPAKPYAAEYGACCDEAHPECRAGTLRPIRAVPGFDPSAYDTVLVGTPNWWGTMAPPVRTFASTFAAQLKGKTVCLFQTHGGGGMQSVGRDFEKVVAGAAVLPPQAFPGAGIRTTKGLEAFVKARFEI